MSFLIGALMVGLGLIGVIVAVTGTQGQLWTAVTGKSLNTTTAASGVGSVTSGTGTGISALGSLIGGSSTGSVTTA